MLKELFTSEKAPYIATLFVAALSWVTVRTIDRLTGTPFIEYRITQGSSDTGASGVVLRIRHITESSRFECVLLTVATRAQETLKFGDPLEQRHGIRGTALTLLTVRITKPDEWVVEATNVAPGTDNTLFIPTSGSGSPVAMVQPCVPRSEVAEGAAEAGAEKGEQRAAGQGPVLIEAGVRTFLVQHELELLWGALLAWLLLLIPYASAHKQTPAGTSTETPQLGGQ
jgi:hypothetical protein